MQLAGHHGGGLVGVVAVHAEQHQQPRPVDLADDRAVDPHRGPGHPGDDRPHGCRPAPAGRAGPARAPRAAPRRPARPAGRSWANASSSTSSPSGSAPRQPASSAAAGLVDLVAPARAVRAGPPRRPTSAQPSVARLGVALQHAPSAPPQPGAEQRRRRRRGRAASPTRSSQPSTSGPERVVEVAGQVLDDDGRRRPSVRRRVRNPNPTASTRSRCQPVQPRAGLRAGRGRVQVEPGVALPGAHVQGRVGHLALHDPRVDARRAARSGPGPASPRRARAATSRAAAPRRRAPGARAARATSAASASSPPWPGVAVDVVDARPGRARTAGWTRSGRTGARPPGPATARRAARRPAR